MWQEKLHILGSFDEIYFDDFPLDISKESSQMEMAVSMKRLNIFLDLCIQNHTRIGSKICWYCNGNGFEHQGLGSDVKPFVELDTKEMEIQIPDNCKYRNLKEQKCTIPLLTKIKRYSFDESQRCAIEEINREMAERKQKELAPSFSYWVLISSMINDYKSWSDDTLTMHISPSLHVSWQTPHRTYSTPPSMKKNMCPLIPRICSRNITLSTM